MRGAQTFTQTPSKIGCKEKWIKFPFLSKKLKNNQEHYEHRNFQQLNNTSISHQNRIHINCFRIHKAQQYNSTFESVNTNLSHNITDPEQLNNNKFKPYELEFELKQAHT